MMSKVGVGVGAECGVEDVDGREGGDSREIRRPIITVRRGADASQARTDRCRARRAPRIIWFGHVECRAGTGADDVLDDGEKSPGTFDNARSCRALHTQEFNLPQRRPPARLRHLPQPPRPACFLPPHCTRRILDALIHLFAIKAAAQQCKISSSSPVLQPIVFSAMQALHYHPFLFALISLVAMAELGLTAWLVSSESLDFPRFSHRYYSM